MGAILIWLGLLGFIVGIVMFIVACIKKSRKIKSLLIILCGVVLFIAGGAMLPSEPDSSANVQPAEVAVELTEEPTEPPTETAVPTEMPTSSATAANNKVQTKEQATEAFRGYIAQHNLDQKYTNFQVKEETDYFAIYTYSNNQSSNGIFNLDGAFFCIDKGGESVEPIGTVDEILTQGLWTDWSASYNGVAVCITQWGHGGLVNTLYGVAQNNKGDTVSADIHFKFYDENDIQVGTSSYFISDLEALSKAKIELGDSKIPSDAARYEITDIDVYDKYQ